MRNLLKNRYVIAIAVFLIIVLAILCGRTPAEETPEATEVAEVAGVVESPKEVTRVVTQEVIKEVTREVTRIVEIPVTVTFTPGPSPTPTETLTPTKTPTFTPSPTPFQVYGCVNLRSVANFWNIEKADYEDRVYPTYDALDGKCVKFYGSESIGMVTTDYGWLSMSFLDFPFEVDDMSPEGIRGVKEYSTVWGILESQGSGEYEILLRRVEPFPSLQQPIEDDGFYMVGEEFEISPGQWKSLWPPGTVDNCYWARTNPDTGDIRGNHFGQAGVYVRVYEGDLFETDDCAPWVFVAP